jgi:uncharacterized damage-inducible protein DinB
MEDLINELDKTTKELLDTVDSFSQEQFNVIPFEGSWTAAQVAEHLWKAESSIPKVLEGASRPTTERQGNEKMELIKSVFLDFTRKYESPEFILPSNERKEKEELLKALKKTRTDIRALTDTVDLSRTFTDFPLPKLGELTGWEWICFAVCHSKRHIRQLKNIYAATASKAGVQHPNEN